MLTIKGVAEAYPSEVLKYENYTDGTFKYLIQKGYNHVRSGNVAFSYNPAWMEYHNKGTTHGASYSYDTHVPLLFYGMGIPKGSSVKKVNIVEGSSFLVKLQPTNRALCRLGNSIPSARNRC